MLIRCAASFSQSFSPWRATATHFVPETIIFVPPKNANICYQTPRILIWDFVCIGNIQISITHTYVCNEDADYMLQIYKLHIANTKCICRIYKTYILQIRFLCRRYTLYMLQIHKRETSGRHLRDIWEIFGTLEAAWQMAGLAGGTLAG